MAKVSHARVLAAKARIKISKAARESLERQTYAEEFFGSLLELLRGYTLVTETIHTIRNQTLSRLIVIATHMHAGDGNVHVNIPVLSNDRKMMKRAGDTADRIMAKALELEGAVSGEHGIGITKFTHLDAGVVEKFTAYRTEVDPTGLMNPANSLTPWSWTRFSPPRLIFWDWRQTFSATAASAPLPQALQTVSAAVGARQAAQSFFPRRIFFSTPETKTWPWVP